MTTKVNKREEGLKELASMIAEVYRRRATGEIVSLWDPSESDEENPISEAEIIVRIEPAESRPGFVYTETVRVENFIRNKVRQVNHKEIEIVGSEGGQNVTNKRSIRDRKASPAGQDKAGNQEGK